jgi:hypothetical protein
MRYFPVITDFSPIQHSIISVKSGSNNIDAYVDKDQELRTKQFKWELHGNHPTARIYLPTSNNLSKLVRIRLDRFITGLTPYAPIKIIHLNGTLDCRRKSLVLMRRSESPYMYHGIKKLDKDKWCIVYNDQQIGDYETDIAAARAYDALEWSKNKLNPKLNFYIGIGSVFDN